MCVFLTALVLLSCKLVSNRLSDRELAATNIAMSFTLIASAEQYNYDIFTTPVPRIKPKKKTARPQTPTSQALESVKTQSGEQNTGEKATPRPTRTPIVRTPTGEQTADVSATPRPTRTPRP